MIYMTNIESVGTIQVIYTVEPDDENADMAIVNYWLPSGGKIGTMRVPRDNGQRGKE